MERSIYFWAKTREDGLPGVSVLGHNLVVGYVALALARRYEPLVRQLGLTPEQIAALAATHDVGKTQWDFQRKCPAWLEQYGWTGIPPSNSFTHGYYTQISLARFLAENGYCSEDAGEYWAAVIGAHHNRVQAEPQPGLPLSREAPDRITGIDWEAERQAILEKAWAHFGRPSLPEADEKTAILWFVGGLICVADWIGSNTVFFPAENDLAPEDMESRAERAVTALGLGPLRLSKELTFCELFGFSPNSLQLLAAEKIDGPGIYVLEAPMGMGKTEAALFVSWHLLKKGKASGIYFALPTRATSNRMHTRLEKFLNTACPEAPRLQLIHGTSWLHETMPSMESRQDDEEDAFVALGWFHSSKRALLAPVGVGTVDQALNAVLNVKHFFLRRFALAGKVVILDEVHSYDVYTGSLVAALCRELIQLGVTVIILSATLTSKAKSALLGIPCLQEEAYPLLTFRRDGSGVQATPAEAPPARTIKVEFAPRADLLHRSLVSAAAGANILWVCNTVGEAQMTYRDLAQAGAEEIDLGLLHSHFPLFLREGLEKKWLDRFGVSGKRSKGCILVSTQIVEQSVDIDADLLITQLCPSDMLLQRIGRLQRHQRPKRPCEAACLIVREECALDALRAMDEESIRKSLGPKAWIYEPLILLQTLEVWEGRSLLCLPDDIRPILNATYAERENLPPSWEKLKETLEGREFAEKQLSRMVRKIWEGAAASDQEGNRTRLSDYPTITLALCRKVDGKKITLLNGDQVRLAGREFQVSTARGLALNSVRLPARWFVIGLTPEALRPYGVDAIGLVEDNVIKTQVLKPGWGLFWDERLGVEAYAQ